LDYGATPDYKGSTPTKPATAQYNYTCTGWDKTITTVTEATDYTATYSSVVNKYEIKFVNYDGSELQSSEVEYGVTPSYTGEVPEKPADAENTYVFTGWSPELTSVTKAQIYTAQFSSTTNLYTIRFLNEDGTELQSEELAYGATPAYTGETPTKEAIAQYTYTFKGWNSEITEVTGAKDYKATYTSTTNKYLITFKNYNGEELQSSEVEYGVTPAYSGEAPEKPADAENTYIFTGWSQSIESVTKAQTYTAQFSSTTNKYLIRFLNEDGTELQSEELAYGTTPEYTGEPPVKEATAQYTYTFKGWDSDIEVVKGAKNYTATYTISYVRQTADNTPECDNAPAVAKYDWLLMLNANALKDKGYNLNENIVDWYRVVGEMDNLDSGERDDEKVGTGYYYTINSKLNDTGDYYALIDLPWQTTEVGCSGLMRTVVFHYAPKGTTKRAMAVSPTITYPEQQIEIVNLPKEEVEVYVYDVAGRLYRSFRTDGEPAAAFKAEPMAGTYIVVVWTSKGKETFKYIVRKR
ncbi:MAG: T9SS type A sorting domain-containing protein, partial [Paludibacteraceae bacterium]|nr:T9SS type A sorting domain-containing protein [Paludibacteraceae bacterium]